MIKVSDLVKRKASQLMKEEGFKPRNRLYKSWRKEWRIVLD